MRRLTTLLLLPVLAAPLAAQDFEGSITMKMTTKEVADPISMTFYRSGNRQAMVMTMPASAGPSAGQEVRMVLNADARKLTMLMPMPAGMPGMPGGGKGMKMTMDLGQMTERAERQAGDAKVTALGSSQEIAGMSCDDYQVTTKDETFKMCMTDQLGRYAFPEMTGRGRPEMPEWMAAFGSKPVFPLKMWKDDGSMSMEVTAVKKGPVDPALLDENPVGYAAMPGMGG